MVAVVLLLLLQVQANQPFKDWKIQRREPNPKTGQQEIIAFIEGDEALPLNTTREKELVDIKGLRLRYFTEPKGPLKPSEEVRLRSDTARLDNEKDRVDLVGHVHVEKPESGTTMDAPEAILFFKKRFVCPVDDRRAEKPGKCPACGADLKPRTFTTLEAPKTFEMNKLEPVTRLTGEALTANDDIRTMRVERNGFLITTGNPLSTAPPPPGAKPAITEMRSKGPMTLVESESGLVVTGEKEVHLQSSESSGAGATTVDADAAELKARRSADPAKKGLDPEHLDARGHVRMETPDSIARGDQLSWDRKGDGEDVAVLEGDRAEVQGSGSRIQARTVTMHRLLGISTFQGDVAALLAPGKGSGDPPLRLQCRVLTTHAEPGTREISDLEALDDVIIEGLTQGAGDKPGRAEADRFTWTPADQHGLLEKSSHVRIVQENSLILAPRVVLEGQSMIVLKGPKRIVLTQNDPDGNETRTTVTSDGDIVLDSTGGRTLIRLRDRCEVRSPELHLLADRMTLATSKESRDVEAIDASGHVRARQEQEGATMFGEWLHLEPKTETRPLKMTLTGAPLALAEAGRTVATQEKILVTEKPDPATGRMVQYQEMRGGKHGVKIVVDEREPEPKRKGTGK